MDPILRDLGRLLHAVREVDLDDRDRQVLRELSSRSDLVTVEVLCSLFEKVREAGLLLGKEDTVEDTVPIERPEPGHDAARWVEPEAGSGW